MKSINKKMLNDIIYLLDGVASNYNGYVSYGLPVYDDGQMALMREALMDYLTTEEAE